MPTRSRCPRESAWSRLFRASSSCNTHERPGRRSKRQLPRRPRRPSAWERLDGWIRLAPGCTKPTLSDAPSRPTVSDRILFPTRHTQINGSNQSASRQLSVRASGRTPRRRDTRRRDRGYILLVAFRHRSRRLGQPPRPNTLHGEVRVHAYGTPDLPRVESRQLTLAAPDNLYSDVRRGARLVLYLGLDARGSANEPARTI